MKIILHDDAARAFIAAAAPAAAVEAGESLLAAARARCPVDTGRLRQSGCVVAHDDGVQICFTAPYAARVHETGGKFLENAANDEAVRAQMLSVFARRLRLE